MSLELASPGPQELVCLNVAVSAKGLTEFSGNKRAVFIPAEQVRRIEIACGFQAERPLIQLVASLVLIGLGITGVMMILKMGVALFRWSCGFLAFGALGPWLLHEASKRGYYLRVICANDTRKLALKAPFKRPRSWTSSPTPPDSASSSGNLECRGCSAFPHRQ